jgi:6-pyruvoyltetrahydropterin/6-carboxytetrahydropterin synthase
VGFSCCFRQHRAKSHCSKLHGYALQIELEFESARKDENNWVVDFGGLKAIKEWLVWQFDHTTLVALDDPYRPIFETLAMQGIIDIRNVEKVGCEAFSELVYKYVDKWLGDKDYKPRVKLTKVTVREHSGNAAWVRAI